MRILLESKKDFSSCWRAVEAAQCHYGIYNISVMNLQFSMKGLVFKTHEMIAMDMAQEACQRSTAVADGAEEIDCVYRQPCRPRQAGNIAYCECQGTRPQVLGRSTCSQFVRFRLLDQHHKSLKFRNEGRHREMEVLVVRNFENFVEAAGRGYATIFALNRRAKTGYHVTMLKE